ncbi:PadR family transcriptional regulator [Halorubrum sp. Ib24]|uniref:helix-turn-helix transcriptional regulator n=1 Tax=unclassified Halorubrum TaxID=2642239 RepID=UPI000B97E999|nr:MULTISPECIES: helix-turn-helix transcriptional regulator [unclassified Halorubrum]OYR39229.1 PadR family transcriptional regulator [Halorubrum sp. Eb13]OYR41837.1 PadR family transcriptional regulator [Halorubrum sp. Ib24]OYR46999.1 PadR family transcriptional regulator [Halorubrum sp. Hd13]OYR47944.1 PadR family transcriptional regulator [Halorubrum sp. Ea8]OYR53206.1 PadR family transcriptional regulator [Halorubrum sp. Ea1]
MMDLTAFQRDLLFTTFGLEEPKGVEVKEAVERYYGSDVLHGRLYPNLDALVEKGLVEKGSHDHRTNKYMLTERGKQQLKSRIEWELSNVPDGIKTGIRSLPERQ